MTIDQYNSCVDELSDNLYRFLLKNIKDEAVASDIVQDSFEKLWIRVNDISYEKVKSYLFTIGYHAMIDIIRREKRMTDFEDINPNHYVQPEVNIDLNKILHLALDRLPEIQRSVILLRDYEGYSYEEIGEITGLTESQVKVYIFRARTYLKNFIGSIEVIL